jgi:hypothetical protein
MWTVEFLGRLGRWSSCCALAFAAVGLTGNPATERVEHFDKDPGWESHNNRMPATAARTVRQDFGYSRTHHAGGALGEMGGWITPAAEPAYYAKKIPARTFEDTLTASGTLACTSPKFHVLLGFFNNRTLKEWRTPNSIAIRLIGRGNVFYAYVEYATRKWRAGGDSPGGFATVLDPDTGRRQLKGFAGGDRVYHWSLRYDPNGNQGGGSIQVTLGEETAVCNLDPGHKADGAVFNRFGLLNIMKSVDDGGEVWLDDVTVNSEREDFSKDPGWESFQNRRTYKTTEVRPHGDFGYSATQFAGGQKGELGGLVFRGDCRYPEAMGCYGDRLSVLTLDHPLKASGKVSLRRGVSDSTTLIGFFHSEDSMSVNRSQSSMLPRSFLGVAVEGPSREGFFFAPVYRIHGEGQGVTGGGDRPHILPDGATHTWSLTYSPEEAGGQGRITVTLDKRSVHLDLQAGHKTPETRFDRFGIITTWIDGNGQRIYFDDLTYTFRQP